MAEKSPRLPLKVRFLLSILSFLNGFLLRSDGTFNRRLLKLVEPKVSPSPKPINGVITADTTIDSSRDLWFRIFTPTTTTATTTEATTSAAAAGATLPVVVFFHGGGFVCGAPDYIYFDGLCRSLAKQLPAVVLSVNYRLSPEHRYPSQYDDGFDSLKFIDDNLISGADLSNCFIAGDSAGGNIAHHVILKACSHNFKTVHVKGLIAIQPFFGGEERTESEIILVDGPMISMKATDWYWKAFLPQGMDRDHEVVNVFGLRAVDISGLDFPMTLLIVGGFDPWSDRQKSYGGWLKSSDKEVKVIEYPNVIHGFYAFTEYPKTSYFVKEIGEFVHQALVVGE